MQLFTFVLVGFFGGLTVFFHDDAFIKWKVTVINVLFALALLIGRWLWQEPHQADAGQELKPRPGLGQRQSRLGRLLHPVRPAQPLRGLQPPPEMWVNFKVFGLLGMTLVFTLLSGVYLYRHAGRAERRTEK